MNTTYEGEARPFHFVDTVSGPLRSGRPDPAGAILLGQDGQAWLRGPQSRVAAIPPATLTIRLQPLAWLAVIGQAASVAADQTMPLPLPLAATTPDALRFLSRVTDPDRRAQAAEDWLHHYAQPVCPVTVRLARSLAAHLNDPDMVNVGQLCDAVGLTQPRLSRLSLKLYGFRPKLLLRRGRFLRTLDAMDQSRCAQWCHTLDPSYVDQSHFIRDCHAFLGMTPTQHLASMAA